MQSLGGICRAKRLDNDEWIYGYHIVIGKRHFIAGKQTKLIDVYKVVSTDPEAAGTFAKIKNVSEVYIDSVCRNTTAKDEAGREIYEYDIVVMNEQFGDTVFPRIGIVIFNEHFAMWCVRFFDGRADAFLKFPYPATVKPTIIGNRYDTPTVVPEKYRFWEEDYE